MKKFLTLAAVATVWSSMTLAEDVAKEAGKPEMSQQAEAPTKTEAKLTEVRFCPMMGHQVAGNGAGQRVYKDYRLFFC